MNRLGTSSIALLAIGMSAWSQELPIDLAGYRSMSLAAQRLRERTGWLISVEEPAWPTKPAATTGREKGIRGTEAPEPDRLRVGLPSLRKQGDKTRALQQIASAFNAQNSTVAYAALRVGDHSVLAAAGSLLGRTVTVAAERRSPEKHLEALASALSNTSGVPVEIDTGAFGFQFGAAYLGAGNGVETPPLTSWGVSGEVAREALSAFLAKSMTSAVWQLNCQPGVRPSSGFCVLSVLPITVEVKNARGRIVKRALMYDRGVGPKGRPLPPPPPEN